MKHQSLAARTKRHAAWITLSALIGVVLIIPPQESLAARKAVKPPRPQGDFVDHLGSYDASRWVKADGWKNGAPFDNAWAADHVTFVDGHMILTLDDQAARGEPYSSGHYQTVGFHGYGCFEASFIPVAEPGVVTSFFTFAGPFDNGGNGHVNEIDIEFLGNHTSSFQANYWTNDDDFSNGHEQLVDLPFDASEGFHRYGFRWTSTGIQWFVDGVQVYEVMDTPGEPTPKANESLQKIMMNLWPVDSTASGWAGPFIYPGVALHGVYDWVRYTTGEDCTFEAPPEPPPPPPEGDPGDLHVAGLDLSLNSRGTQAIARLTILNGSGLPVSNATVIGSWSGIVSNGDTSRTTDDSGTALFYSARFRKSGELTFCVSSVVASDMNHDESADVETCDTISN